MSCMWFIHFPSLGKLQHTYWLWSGTSGSSVEKVALVLAQKRADIAVVSVTELFAVSWRPRIGLGKALP